MSVVMNRCGSPHGVVAFGAPGHAAAAASRAPRSQVELVGRHPLCLLPAERPRQNDLDSKASRRPTEASSAPLRLPEAADWGRLSANAVFHPATLHYKRGLT
jgi:hypothetical protein